MNPYRVFFLSLGCAKNLVNTEQMLARTVQAGHQIVSEASDAEIAVVNTCGFIDSAKSEAIDHILGLAQLKEQGLRKIIVTGCLSQRYGEEILSELPEVDGLVGCGSYSEIVTALEEAMEDKTPCLFGDIDNTDEEGARIVTTPPWTAYLKIAEGCDNRCAYCVIPSLRGKFRSRPMENLVREAEVLAESGVRELIVIAQDITRYGTDWDGKRHLSELLRKLCAIPGLHWIRLHYLYPDELDDALISVMAEEEKILPYLDIPIQHCNDRILAAMNRRGTKEELLSLFARIREKIPNVVLRTSIICGLPGEDEAAFEELCEFLQEVQIQRAGVFPFSPQEGTPAAEMDGQVDEETAAHRAELLTDLQSRIMDTYNDSLIGTCIEVLCEGYDRGRLCYVGRSQADSPDIDGRVFFTSEEDVIPGTFVWVRITGTIEGDLEGEREDKE